MTRPAGWKGFGFAWQAGCPECQAMPASSWYYNWGCASAWTCPVCGNVWNPYTYSPTYVPMLYSGMATDTNAQVASLLAAYPGRAWMVWNEPDLREVQPTPGQWVPLELQAAARNYARAYWFIKANDPSAWVGGPNLVCMDENGRCTTSPWSRNNGSKDYFQEFVQELRVFAAQCSKPVPRFDFYCVHAWPYTPLSGTKAGGMWPMDDGKPTYETLNRHIDWIRSPQFADVLSPYAHIWITETGIDNYDTNIHDHNEAKLNYMDPLVAWLDSTGFGRLVTHAAWYTTTEATAGHILPNLGDLLFDSRNVGGRFEREPILSAWVEAGGAQATQFPYPLTLVGGHSVDIRNTHEGWWANLYQSADVSAGTVLFSFYHMNGGDMYGPYGGAHVKVGFSPNTDELYNSGLLDGDGASVVRRSVELAVSTGTIWITLLSSSRFAHWHRFDDVLLRQQGAQHKITPLGSHWGSYA